jgi:hypothetical protein
MKYLGLIRFYNPPNLSHSSDVYIRVSEKGTEMNTKSRTVRMKNVDKDTTIKTLKQRAWEILKINKVCRRRIYYYGYELFDDVCPLAPHFAYFIDQDKLPIIFDLVLIETQLKGTVSSSTDIHHIENKPNIFNDDDDDNSSDLYETDYEIFLRNFAFIYYVRVCMHVAVSNR